MSNSSSSQPRRRQAPLRRAREGAASRLVARFLLLLLLTSAGGVLSAQQVDRKKLQQAARMPSLSFNIGFAFSATRGLVLSGDDPGPEEGIAAAKKAAEKNPADAEAQTRLGSLLEAQGNKEEAKKAWERAVELLREQSRASPKDALTLVQLGQALSHVDREEEAETTLRKATTLAPKEWRAWVALGQFLTFRTVSVLTETKWNGEEQQAMRLLAQIQQNRPPADRVERAEKTLQEAVECHEKAVTAAPQSPEPYAARGALRTALLAYLRCLIETARGQAFDLTGAMLPPEALADLRRAASLQPSDYRMVASAAMAEVMAFILQSGQKPDWAQGRVWKAMPESSRQALREAMKRLAPLSESKETDTAIGASLALGYLYFLTNDPLKADELARRAIRLDPKREVSWDVLAGMMALNNRFQEMVPLCQERLKSRDTSRNRLLLAKALEKTGQLEQAQAQVYEALKTDPDGFMPNLALAVLLMKRSDGEATLREVGDILARIEQKQRAAFTRDEYVEFLFSYGIYTALSGNDREAETVFRRVLELDNGLQEAREALRALGKDAP